MNRLSAVAFPRQATLERRTSEPQRADGADDPYYQTTDQGDTLRLSTEEGNQNSNNQIAHSLINQEDFNAAKVIQEKYDYESAVELGKAITQERRPSVPQRADGADDPAVAAEPARANVSAAQQAQVIGNVPDAPYKVYKPFSDVQSCFEALAMGMMGISHDTLEMVLTRLSLNEEIQLSDLYFDCEIECYAKRMAIELFEFFKSNKGEIMNQVIEQGGCTAEEIKSMSDYCRTQTGVMPQALLVSMARSLGVKIGFNQESNVFILIEDGKYKPQFPKEKLHLFNTTQDLQQNGLNRIESYLKISSDVLRALSGERLTLETMQVLFDSIFHHPMGSQSILPILGQTQTGKSSLFNYLLNVFHMADASDYDLLDEDISDEKVSDEEVSDELDVDQLLRQRVGNGSNSKTAVFFQQFLNGYLVTDTPGLGENREQPMLELMVQYQLIELLSSNSFPGIILTLQESDFSGNMATSGINQLKRFLSKYFDLKAVDNGFYDRISTEKEVETFKTLKQWDAFLGEIASAIESMNHYPFLTVVKPNDRRSNIGSSEGLHEVINDFIEELKSIILKDIKRALKGSDTAEVNSNIESNILLLIYCLFIKKDVHISDLSEGNSSLQEKVYTYHNRAFDFKDIAIPITQLQPIERQLKEEITSVLRTPIDHLGEMLKVSSSCHDKLLSIQSQYQAINQLEMSLEATELTLAQKMEMVRLKTVIEIHKKNISDLNNSIESHRKYLAEFDVATMVESHGFPVIKHSQSHVRTYIQFSHEGHDSDSITVTSEDMDQLTPHHRPDYKLFRYPFWIKRRRGLTYKATFHKKVEKRSLHQYSINKTRTDMSNEQARLQEENRSLNLAEASLKLLQDVQSSKGAKEEELKVLNHSYCQIKDELNKQMTQLKELHNAISEQKEGMSVMHQLLGNETLTYLNTLMAESDEKVDFIKMVESVFQNN